MPWRRHSSAGLVLFNRGLGHAGTELLDIGDYGLWSDVLHLKASLFTPVEELPNGNGIGHPGVPIAGVRRENSMKGSLVRAPAATIATGNVSRPARTSAGGAAMAPSSVKSMGSWGSLDMGSAASSAAPFSYHKGVGQELEASGAVLRAPCTGAREFCPRACGPGRCRKRFACA
jgi:hypothetical protein